MCLNDLNETHHSIYDIQMTDLQLQNKKEPIMFGIKLMLKCALMKYLTAELSFSEKQLVFLICSL